MLKFTKKILVFITLFGIIFSDIPFYALSAAIDGYIKGQNIVDKAWHLQRDPNVVDKFASLRNLADNLKIEEVSAATSGQVYPTLGVTIAESPWLDNNWTAPTAVYVDDGTTANVTGASYDSPDQTYVLKATGFDFSAIPDGATINGVTARINAWYRSGQGAGAVDLCQLLDINNAKVGTNQCATQVALTTTNTTIITKGSTSDTWGNSLTTAWIKDPNFGIALGIKATAANADVDVDYVTLEIEYTPPADSDPPTPSPMTFFSAPSNASVSQIDMTATTASDPSTPVSYLFTNDNSACGANAGTGGTSSSWQTSTGYSDSGLQPNKCYGYTVTARDSLSNTGTASDISFTYTSANIPSAPTVGSPTTSSLVITNNENGNSVSNPTTLFAVQVTTTDGNWNGKWVDGSGNASVSETWLSDATITNLTVNGLAASTQYDFAVKAKNEDGEETSLGATGSGTTDAPAGPDATSYTNTDTALNFANCATTGCGARSSGQIITVTGSSFGADPGAGNRSTASNNVKVGTYQIPDANITSWSDSQIVINAPSGVTVFGGTDSAGLIVTAGGNVDTTPLEFWIFPNITDVSPSGAGEAKEGDSITITGSRFDTTEGTVVFQNCAVAGDVFATVGSWGDNSISVTVPTGIDDNDDACDIKVTRAAGTGSKNHTSVNFKVLPDLITVAVCSGCNAGADREYDSGVNTYGIVMLSGKHFGAAGSATILGTSATLHTTIEGPCTTSSYSATSVCYRVPDVSDSLYTGNIVLNRTADSKTSSFAFRILPKITGFTPTSGIVSDAVTVNGDHLCQSGSCPGGFDVNNKVTFSSSVDATVCTDWTSDTGISTQVPSGAVTGDVTVTSNSIYVSNGKSFTVLSPTPSDPTGLGQYTDSGLTQSLTTGELSTSVPIYLTMTMQVGVSGGTLYPQIEYKPVGTSFDCSGTGVCAQASEGTGVAGPGPIDCSSAGNGCAISISPTDGNYHWQARVRHNKGGVHYYSSWMSFPLAPSDNLESATDFGLDTAGPGITDVSAGTITDVSAIVAWTTDESANQQVAYGGPNAACPAGALPADVFDALALQAGGGKLPSSPSGSGTSHSVSLAGLTANSTYYYMVRSADGAGNISYSPNTTTCDSSFSTTAAVNRIMKTTEYYICQDTATAPNWTGGAGVACGSAGAKSFDVYAAEHSASSSISQNSAYIEIFGVTNASSNFDVIVSVNGETAVTYTISSPAGSSLPWFIVHPVSSFNIDYAADTSATNLLDISFAGTISSTSLLGAKAILTYYYTP